MDSLLDGYPVITEIPVAWGEMDALQHVNNVVYFRYFETARLDYFTHIGLMEELKESRVGPVLSGTQSRYRLPVTYPDTLLVGSRVSAVDKDRFTMEYIIVSRQQQQITTYGQADIVMFDFNTHSKAEISHTLRGQIEKLQPDLVCQDTTDLTS
ncbi:thioesterase [Photobacterium aquae]|uniref:Thioesterase n=1 Tax=Photobacterium aquae TaxID=1195763 RepID=A0A0J1H566_9GAMM|nr:acyl-CoA thioesterase [Photobacterium aquae]KLV06924.1 thioesterase [Photobacterium aquae]